jgi:hypothetical protein
MLGKKEGIKVALSNLNSIFQYIDSFFLEYFKSKVALVAFGLASKF